MTVSTCRYMTCRSFHLSFLRNKSTLTIPSDSRPKLIWWICLGAIALILLNAARTWPEAGRLLFLSDNDDLMRLVEVRDLLGGQDWFDTRQYRILPPEGISMHWSRYVDAGIAALIVPASWLLPMPQAELLAVVLWPSLLACLMVLLIGLGTNRLFGPLAALGALVVFLTWSKLRGEFTPPRLDHHNVQMLCATALFYLAVVPARSMRFGVLAGSVSALSLAVGLEMLPVLALVPGWMALRHAFDHAGADRWLLGYGAALAVVAPVLMASQTSPTAYGDMHCDVLALPVLSLAGTGVVATLAPVLAGRVLRGPFVRIVTMTIVVVLGLWLSAPLLSPCLAGPYANVPAAVRDLIESRVVEALPASELFHIMPDLLARTLVPPLAIIALALAATIVFWQRLQAMQRSALVLAFLVEVAGISVALLQIRAATLMVPALPFLGGFLIHAFQQISRTSPLRLPALLGLFLAMPTVSEEALSRLIGPPAARAATTAVATQPGATAVNATCRSASAMAELADLPKSTLLSTLNLGTTILAYTPHSVASAPYHRSSEAFWNGIAAPESEANMRVALSRSGADYLVLCLADAAKPYAAALLAGDLPDWLDDVTGERKELKVFRVAKTRLAEVGGP